MSDRELTRCPTCGSDCYLGGEITRYFVPTFDKDERIDELENYNVGLAGENEKLRELLRKVSCMMHLWDIGLDAYDGDDYQEALEVWEALLPEIDSELDRTDPPTPGELRDYEVRKPK